MKPAPYAEGPLDAKICLIGEAAGETEFAEKRPFVGDAGQKLDKLLNRAGILRSTCRIENVFQLWPADNDLSPYIRFKKSGEAVISPEYTEAVEALKERLEQCSANVFVPLGNIPLYALAGYAPPMITKRRGSILTSTLLPGKKVIPTIHPSAALRQYLYGHHITHDLVMIRRESEFPEVRYLKRFIITEPSFDDAINYLKECHDHSPVAFDIEVKYDEISHISFAISATSGICIPLIDGGRDYFDPEQELEIWKEIAKLLSNPDVTKIGHNITFDSGFIFQKLGIQTSPVADTMVAFGVAFPDFPKKLEFLTATYCEGEPYYKDERKTYFTNPFATEHTFRLYSAKDSLTCRQCWDPVLADLDKLGNVRTYERQVNLVEPLVFMQTKGIKLDTEAMAKESKEAGEKIEELTTKLREVCGYNINPASTDQVKEYFYEKRGHKPYTKTVKREGGRREQVVTVDKNALKRLAAKGEEAAVLMLGIRKHSKAKNTYYDMKVDADGRLRCSYNPVGTVQGRISSSQTILGIGANMLNLTAQMKRMMVPDEGHIFGEIDLSQAENRVVAYIANETRMIRAFEAGKDVHRLTAGLILNKDPDDISDVDGSSPIGNGEHSERFWGKKADHAFNYDEGPVIFALDNEIEVSEAKRILTAYHHIYPTIRQWHASVRNSLAGNQTLTNCLGRNRYFMGRWGNDLFKAAYSFNPQSTVADKLNEDGFCFMYYEEGFENFILLNQIYDSIVFEFPIATGLQAYCDGVCRVRDKLEENLEWHGRSFSIPADFKTGFNLDKCSLDNPNGLKEFEHGTFASATELCRGVTEIVKMRTS